MLERFHVPDSEAVRLRADDVRAATEAIFDKMGLSQADAARSADVLVYADLKGIDTHGISNMLRMYVQGYQTGETNPRPQPRIVREAPAVATMDGDGGLGLHIGPLAMELAIEKAKSHGMGAVAVRNAGHVGAAGYHAAMALEHDMIGVCMAGGGGAALLPTFGAEPRFGTNPISWAAPAKDEAPFIFDIALTQVAGNKIRLLQRMGVNAAPGWLADWEGTPIMVESSPPAEDIRAEGRHWYMLPAGGTRENSSHKGYGFACVVAIMGATLAGAQTNANLAGSGHYFGAYRIDAFTDADGFKEDMDSFLRGLRETPPAPGHERVYYAGLPEYEEELERREKGIPYHPEVVEWLNSICGELELDFEFP